MRFPANILLSLLLLFATSGISMSKHYCMGRLKSVAVFSHADHCENKSQEENMPCCEHTEELLLLDELSQSSFEVDLAPARFVLWTNDFRLFHQPQQANHSYAVAHAHSPPDQEIIIRLQNLRI